MDVELMQYSLGAVTNKFQLKRLGEVTSEYYEPSIDETTTALQTTEHIQA
jgi:hypothetical protein